MENAHRILRRPRQDAHSFTVLAAKNRSATNTTVLVQAMHTGARHRVIALRPSHLTDANAITVPSATLVIAIVAGVVDAFQVRSRVACVVRRVTRYGHSTTPVHLSKVGSTRNVDTDTGTVGSTATIGITCIDGVVNTRQTQIGGTFQAANAATQNLGVFANDWTSAKGAVVAWIVNAHLTVAVAFGTGRRWRCAFHDEKVFDV
jgi:hypothetical protein